MTAGLTISRRRDEGLFGEIEVSRRDLSIVILAGGKSERMGYDKAFLTFRGHPFIKILADRMLKVSSEVIVAIGIKDPWKFKSSLDNRVRVVNDARYLMNPLGGMLSALSLIHNRYAAILACDSPLVKPEVVLLLHQVAQDHDAAVPIWDDGFRIEPLCAVYDAKEAERAGTAAIEDGKLGPKHMVSYLRDVNYLAMSTLRNYDPQLLSFVNVNTPADYVTLGCDRISGGHVVPLGIKKKAQDGRSGFGGSDATGPIGSVIEAAT